MENQRIRSATYSFLSSEYTKVLALTLPGILQQLEHKMQFTLANSSDAYLSKLRAEKVAGSSQLRHGSWPLLEESFGIRDEMFRNEAANADNALALFAHVPAVGKTRRFRHLVLKLRSAVGALHHSGVEIKTEQFPKLLWQLLGPPAMATEANQKILARCPRLRDAYANSFIQKYAPAGLDQFLALLELRSIGAVAKTNTVRIECTNAKIRLALRMKSNQCSPPELIVVAAEVLLSSVRAKQRNKHRPAHSRKPRKARRRQTCIKDKPRRSDAMKKLKRRGGGGLWRKYVSHR